MSVEPKRFNCWGSGVIGAITYQGDDGVLVTDNTEIEISVSSDYTETLSLSIDSGTLTVNLADVLEVVEVARKNNLLRN